jgi:hypothetical protein
MPGQRGPGHGGHQPHPQPANPVDHIANAVHELVAAAALGPAATTPTPAAVSGAADVLVCNHPTVAAPLMALFAQLTTAMTPAGAAPVAPVAGP